VRGFQIDWNKIKVLLKTTDDEDPRIDNVMQKIMLDASIVTTIGFVVPILSMVQSVIWSMSYPLVKGHLVMTGRSWSGRRFRTHCH